MTKTTAQKKLIVASGRSVASPFMSLPDYIRMMVYVSDSKLAAELVVEQSELEFYSASGKDLSSLEMEKEELDALYKVSRIEQDQLENQRKNTKRFIKCPNDQRKKFLSWDLKDQCSMVLLIPSLIAVMAMGGVNTYANLMASGEYVFLEQPWLAVCLSILIPAGSTALKFISYFFDYAYTKKRYALGVYVLTIIAILAWSITFSLNFTGVSGGMDLDLLDESGGGKGSLLVFLQIACEILIAAALFLAIEEVNLIYNPPVYELNPEYVEVDKTCKQHKSGHEKLSEKRNHVTSTLAVLKKSCREHVINRQLEFYALIASRTI